MTTHSAAYPKRAKSNLVEQLRTELEDAVAQGEKFHAAFREVALKWLGYEQDSFPIIIDAAHDRGFDGFRMAKTEVDIFQTKSRDFTKNIDILKSADAAILTDIPRILTFLQSADFAKDPAQQVGELSRVHRNPSRLIFREQFGR